MMLVNAAVDPYFVFLCFLCHLQTVWINRIHAFCTAAWFVFWITKPWLGSFLQARHKMTARRQSMPLLSSELIHPHPHCLFGSRLHQADGLAWFLRFKIHTCDFSLSRGFRQHCPSICYFLCYFLIASQTCCFCSCSCSVIVQRTPVAHVHLTAFTSVSWQPHFCLFLCLLICCNGMHRILCFRKDADIHLDKSALYLSWISVFYFLNWCYS